MASATPVFVMETVMQDSHLESKPSIEPNKGGPFSKTKVPRSELDLDDDDVAASDADEVASTASISSSILLRHNTPSSRLHPHHHLPPLPDLRFEQSYLASISSANGDPYKIALITLRDQVVFPLVQGMVFSLGLAGWRAWNSRARFLGRGVGARIRRWWWGVNKWEIPEK